jgi:hypothetical protein
VPNNIRDLLARERVGNVYMRQLAFLTYLGVVLLAFRAAGLAPIKIAIPFFIVTVGIAMMAFVILGARAFNLFDPTILSYDLFEQLRRDYLQMTAGAYRSLDPSFQHYAHRTSRAALDTFATLAEITGTEAHLSGQPYLTLCQQMLLFAINYEPEKKRIPTESRWYAQRHTHPDWYRTGDSETALAHTGATLLSAKAVSDRRWIEKELLPVGYDCIQKNIPLGRFEIVSDLLRYVDAYLKVLAKEHEVQAAFRILDDLTSSCGALIFEPKKPNQEQEPLERMSIVDALASMPITIFLAYLETVKDFGRASIRMSIRKINWKSSKSIYQVGLPSHVLPRLEWLRPRIEFEMRSEGRRITPDWYLDELTIQPTAENLKSAISALVVDVQTIYDKWVNLATVSKLPWIGATILSRETEYWSKFEYQLWRLQERWTDLGSERRIDGLPWPTLDFDLLNRDRGQRLKRLARLKSAQATVLSQLKRPDDYPDFGGQFLHTAGETLFTAMCGNDADTVNSLFPEFFRSSLLQFNRILESGAESDWRLDLTIKVALAPVLDLMDLSGYSILLSELHDNSKISDTIVTLWSRYLDAKSDSAADSKASFLAGAISLTDESFGLAHRSLIRTKWRQDIFHRLRQLDRRAVTHGREGFFLSQQVIVHQSTLVKVYAGDDLGTFHDGIDVFILRILRAREDGKDLKFGTLRERLGEELAREGRRSSAEDEENG